MHKTLGFLFSISCALYISIPDLGKPYNILFLISLFYSIFLCLKLKKVPHADYSILFVVLLFLFYLSKLFFVDDYSNNFFIFNVLNFVMALIIMSSQKFSYNLYLIRWSTVLTFLVFSFEAYYRFSHPYFEGGTHNVSLGKVDLADDFYRFKINSLMYLNSNGVGMHTVFLFSFILVVKTFLSNFKVTDTLFLKHELNFYLLITFVFSILSLSRGAALICLLVYTLYVYLNLKHFFRLIITVPLVIVFTLFSYLSYQGFLNDDSFATKFEIINNLVIYLNAVDLFDLFFGNPYGDPYLIFSGFNGFVGHTHYFELLFFGGILGTLLYCVFLISLSIRDKYIFFYFVLPFLLIGFSNVRLFAHYMFFYIGWAIVIKFKSLSSNNEK